MILALIQIFEGQIEKIPLQKLLFLFTKRQLKAEYEFIPYQYGCFSYSANADLSTMVKKGILKETKTHFKMNESINYIHLINLKDKELLMEIKVNYGKMSANDLMKHTYINFPYWAINSIKAKTILSSEHYEKVNKSRPKNNDNILFTIGYEGISLEEYLNRLIKNDVKVLVDVRNNPLSMKYGFNKSQLQRYCDNLGIKYVHFPEVGIQSKDRQELNTQKDYDNLFLIYCENNLTKTTDSQLIILNLLKENKRIALTCFEANICQCHRKHLAESIAKLPYFTYKLEHI
ncbi:MAG: DUF488 family protein [Sediminibacterium sp.]|nr:DUF488 family protein [Sediminibacterium sp.]